MMLDDFSLIISTARGNEQNACSEAWYLLGELGDRESKVDRTNVVGLVVAKTKLEPIQVVKKLKTILQERPWEFRYVLKVTPIEHVVPADLEKLAEIAKKLEGKIDKNEKYRITVEKRHSPLSSKEIIEAMAAGIGRKVDLTEPDRIVLVQVIGKLAGLAVITEEDILSVEREKRGAK